MNLPGKAFFTSDGGDPIEGASSERRNSRLHANLDSLKRTKSKVGNELGGRTGSQVNGCLIAVCQVLSRKIGVELLEEFVSTIFEGPLRLEG